MPLEMLGAFSVSYRIGHEAGCLLSSPFPATHLNG